MPKSATPSFKRRPRWSAVEASDVLAALKSSGLSMAAFARREGLDSSRLRKWVKRLDSAMALTSAAPTFVEVARRPSAPIEVLMPSGLTLRVVETVDPEALARIVRALATSARC